MDTHLCDGALEAPVPGVHLLGRLAIQHALQRRVEFLQGRSGARAVRAVGMAPAATKKMGIPDRSVSK